MNSEQLVVWLQRVSLHARRVFKRFRPPAADNPKPLRLLHFAPLYSLRT
jgi:hypothetical protein